MVLFNSLRPEHVLGQSRELLKDITHKYFQQKPSFSGYQGIKLN